MRLAVSTANLLRRNVPPRIRKMQVTTHKPRTTKKVLARRFVVRRHLRTARRHRRGPRRAAANRALALQLPAAGRVTIPSDGREVVVPLASKTVRSKLSYETVPKLYPYVYQQVKLTNPFSFPMLPGRVAVYRGNTLIGPAPLQQRAPGEPFAFSLGVQNQLQVRRYIKAEKRHPAGTLSSKQRLEHHYKIEVGNWTRRRQRVRVLENIPVARVSEIKVELDSKTTKPTSWDKRDGILSWTLVVPPRSKRTITVAFTVKLPKNYRVSGY